MVYAGRTRTSGRCRLRGGLPQDQHHAFHYLCDRYLCLVRLSLSNRSDMRTAFWAMVFLCVPSTTQTSCPGRTSSKSSQSPDLTGFPCSTVSPEEETTAQPSSVTAPPTSHSAGLFELPLAWRSDGSPRSGCAFIHRCCVGKRMETVVRFITALNSPHSRGFLRDVLEWNGFETVETLTDQAHRSIKRYILGGHIPTDERLTEGFFAEKIRD